jgi:hypothetical protein
MSYLINKRVELSKTTRYRLSIQVGLSGFSFAVCNDIAGTCLQLHHYSFLDTQDHNDIYTEAITWCNKHPVLKKVFASAQCVYISPSFTLIPESAFLPTNAASILQSIHNISDLDEVYFYHLPQFGATCIYSIPNSITAPILKNQSSIRFYSIAVQLIQMTMSLYGHTRALFFYRNQHLYLIVMKEHRLLLCNAYHAEEFNTALYFLFFSLHQWQLNPESLRLYISGQISKQNRQILHTYFPKIAILSNDSIGFSTSELNLQYSTILHSCESSEEH